MDLEFDELKREFLAEARSRVDEIATLLDRDGFGSDASRERGTYLAHQLKGAGGSYGYADISSESASLELELEAAEVDGDRVRSRIEKLSNLIQDRLQELSSHA